MFQKKRIHNPGIPIYLPFDITRKGNAVEADFEIKEEIGDVGFYLMFCYDDPRRSKYRWIDMVKSFFPSDKLPTAQERADHDRVIKLIGGGIPKDHSNPYGKWTRYPGIKTPIRLIITKFSDKGKEIIFDEVSEPERYTSFDKKIKSPRLYTGKYRVRAEAVKNSPEFIETEVIFFGGRIRGKY